MKPSPFWKWGVYDGVVPFEDWDELPLLLPSSVDTGPGWTQVAAREPDPEQWRHLRALRRERLWHVFQERRYRYLQPYNTERV